MTHPSQRPGSAPGDDDRRSTPVSPLLVPLMLLGLLVGFVAGYFLLWWGLVPVAIMLAIAVSAVLRGRDRDGATGAVVGVVLGYAGVMLVALFRGVL